MASDVVPDVAELLGQLRRHETLLWLLIDAQHGLESHIDAMIRTRRTAGNASKLRTPDSLARILSEYEVLTWQVVPVQLKLRLKLYDWTAEHEIVKDEEELADAEATAIEHVTDVCDVPASIDGSSMFPDILTVDDVKYESIEVAGDPEPRMSMSFASAQPLGPRERLHANVRPRATCQQFQSDEQDARHPDPSHKVHACRFCGRKFSQLAYMHRHMQRKHSGKRPYGCDACPKRFVSDRILREHKRSSHGSRIECTACGKSLKNPVCLLLHMRNIHGAHDRRPQSLCAECGKAFRCESMLTAHMRTHTGERPFACTACDFRAAQAAALREHMKVHTGRPALECAHCRKVFVSKRGLANHEANKHATDKPFACGHCDKRFALKAMLVSHQRVHTGEKPHACTVCGMEYRTRAERELHVKRVHTGERPFECAICEERFLMKTQLVAHMAMHTGLKPFPCDRCDKRYCSAGALLTHGQVEHSTEPPAFKCTICERAFKRPEMLRRHNRSHTGEKPYSCKVCQKAFADSPSVTVHMRTHTGEMPYVCDVCGRRFKDKRNMGKHKKIHEK